VIRRTALAFALSVLLAPALHAQNAPAKPRAQRPKEARPEPTVADYAYGTDSERQKLDFWKADSQTPTPVVFLIHGGGWVGGDKSNYRGSAIKPFLDAGISVAAVNYRFIPQAM
jgi:acetyl esterase/lipase